MCKGIRRAYSSSWIQSPWRWSSPILSPLFTCLVVRNNMCPLIFLVNITPLTLIPLCGPSMKKKKTGASFALWKHNAVAMIRLYVGTVFWFYSKHIWMQWISCFRRIPLVWTVFGWSVVVKFGCVSQMWRLSPCSKGLAAEGLVSHCSDSWDAKLHSVQRGSVAFC